MKTLVLALAAFSAFSAFADNATLEESGSKQTLTITGRRIMSPRRGIPKVAEELETIGMNAPDTYKVGKHPDATSFDGKYMSGYAMHRMGATQFVITIEQRKSSKQSIFRDKSDETEGTETYVVYGDAAEEIYSAAIESGYEVHKPGRGSRSPDTFVKGNDFTCVMSPLGGDRYHCTLEVTK